MLLGERHGIAQNLEFIAKLVPHLWSAGVRRIALEFFAAENQDNSDALVSSSTYDEVLVREMLFEYNVGWPFAEYQSVHQAVWEFNHKNNANMRVLHPSYIYDWSKWAGERTDDSMRGVLHKGNVNLHRAKVIAEAVRGSEKVLGLFGAVHAIKDKSTLTSLGFPNFESVAQILEQTHSIKVASINLNDALSGVWDSEIKTSSPLTPCTLDLDFIASHDFTEVQAAWPDPDWQSPPIDEKAYWQIMQSRRSAFLS